MRPGVAARRGVRRRRDRREARPVHEALALREAVRVRGDLGELAVARARERVERDVEHDLVDGDDAGAPDDRVERGHHVPLDRVLDRDDAPLVLARRHAREDVRDGGACREPDGGPAVRLRPRGRRLVGERPLGAEVPDAHAWTGSGRSPSVARARRARARTPARAGPRGPGARRLARRTPRRGRRASSRRGTRTRRRRCAVRPASGGCAGAAGRSRRRRPARASPGASRGGRRGARTRATPGRRPRPEAPRRGSPGGRTRRERLTEELAARELGVAERGERPVGHRALDDEAAVGAGERDALVQRGPGRDERRADTHRAQHVAPVAHPRLVDDDVPRQVAGRRRPADPDPLRRHRRRARQHERRRCREERALELVRRLRGVAQVHDGGQRVDARDGRQRRRRRPEVEQRLRRVAVDPSRRRGREQRLRSRLPFAASEHGTSVVCGWAGLLADDRVVRLVGPPVGLVLTSSPSW